MNTRLVAVLAIAASIALAGCDRGMTQPDPSRVETGHGPHLAAPSQTAAHPATAHRRRRCSRSSSPRTGVTSSMPRDVRS